MRCGTRGALVCVAFGLYCLLRLFASEQQTITQMETQNQKLLTEMAHMSEVLAESKQHEAEQSAAKSKYEETNAHLTAQLLAAQAELSHANKVRLPPAQPFSSMYHTHC